MSVRENVAKCSRLIFVVSLSAQATTSFFFNIFGNFSTFYHEWSFPIFSQVLSKRKVRRQKLFDRRVSKRKRNERVAAFNMIAIKHAENLARPPLVLMQASDEKLRPPKVTPKVRFETRASESRFESRLTRVAQEQEDAEEGVSGSATAEDREVQRAMIGDVERAMIGDVERAMIGDVERAMIGDVGKGYFREVADAETQNPGARLLGTSRGAETQGTIRNGPNGPSVGTVEIEPHPSRDITHSVNGPTTHVTTDVETRPVIAAPTALPPHQDSKSGKRNKMKRLRQVTPDTNSDPDDGQGGFTNAAFTDSNPNLTQIHSAPNPLSPNGNSTNNDNPSNNNAQEAEYAEIDNVPTVAEKYRVHPNIETLYRPEPTTPLFHLPTRKTQSSDNLALQIGYNEIGKLATDV